MTRTYHNQQEWDAAEDPDSQEVEGVCHVCQSPALGIEESDEDEDGEHFRFKPDHTCPQCDEALCEECNKLASDDGKCAACVSEDAIERSMKEATTT